MTTTFRKPTHSGLYSKWSSFVPHRYKINLVNCLLERSYKICNSYQLISAEFHKIQQMLTSNGYPKYFLDRCVREFFNKKFSGGLVKQHRNYLKTITVRLPFLGEISHHLSKELNTFLRMKTANRINLRVVHTTNKIGNNFWIKDKPKILNKSNVVYKLCCSCGASYIGQTRRNLTTRLKEHASSDKSEVGKHLILNPSHRIDFSTPYILGSARDQFRLLESLFIQENEPQLNVDTVSSPLYILNS